MWSTLEADKDEGRGKDKDKIGRRIFRCYCLRYCFTVHGRVSGQQVVCILSGDRRMALVIRAAPPSCASPVAYLQGSHFSFPGDAKCKFCRTEAFVFYFYPAHSNAVLRLSLRAGVSLSAKINQQL
jgi:hypothetical protein